MTTALGIKNKNKKSSNSLSPQLIHTKKDVVKRKERKERQQRAYDDDDEVEEEGYLEFLNLVHPPSDGGGDREERDCRLISNNNITMSSNNKNVTTSTGGGGSIFDNFICHGGISTTANAVLSDDDDDDVLWVPLEHDNNNQTADDGPTPPAPATNNDIIPPSGENENNDNNDHDSAAIIRTKETIVGYTASSSTSASWSIGLVSPTNSLSSTTAASAAAAVAAMGRDANSLPKISTTTTADVVVRKSTTTTAARGTTMSGRPVRCYRLNLERPFDIHAEQSPLEYGDYMSPWGVEVRPLTTGPVHYCPPRHLGGNVDIWRELLRGSTNTTNNNDRKVVETKKKGMKEEEEEGEEEKTNSLDSLENNKSWRVVSRDEKSWINGLNERDAITGEYLFSTYDLSHVDHPRHHHPRLNKRQLDDLDDDDPTSSGKKNDVSGASSLCYCNSNTTENDERDHANMTEDMLADETARLFRRSELSLRELAESRAASAAAAALSLPPRQVSEGSAAASIVPTAIEGTNTTTTTVKSPNKKKSMSKKLFGSMSRALENMQGTPLNNASTTTTSSMTVLPQDQQSRRGSAQAMTIDKARDLIDDGEGDVEGAGGEGGDEKKRPINISLYIMGEYDILNDLAIDGARRLGTHAASSDIDLLRQNLPCPPPNRWVRCTGWGKCNPSSMYAKDPPVDFDWEKYYDKLRLTTGPGMKREGSASATSIKRGSTKDDTLVADGAITTTATNDGMMINPQDILRKATGDALEGIIVDQNTTTYPTIVSEFDLSQDIYHRIDGRLIKVTRADYVATTEAVTSVVPAGRSGASHFNKPKVAGQQQVRRAYTETTSPKSMSTPPPSSKRATTTGNSTSLSHSASTPVISSSSTSTGTKPKKGLVRIMSSIMGKKK